MDYGARYEYARFGEVYDAVGACDTVETLLGRLRRQHFIDEGEWHAAKQELANIRTRLEGHITSAALLPKGPRLP